MLNFEWLVLNEQYPNFSNNNFNLQKEDSYLSSYGMHINILSIVLSLKIPEQRERKESKRERDYKGRNKLVHVAIEVADKGREYIASDV